MAAISDFWGLEWYEGTTLHLPRCLTTCIAVINRQRHAPRERQICRKLDLYEHFTLLLNSVTDVTCHRVILSPN